MGREAERLASVDALQQRPREDSMIAGKTITIGLDVSDETLEVLERLNNFGVAATRVIHPEAGDKVILLLRDGTRLTSEQRRQFKEMAEEALGFPTIVVSEVEEVILLKAQAVEVAA